MVFQLLRLKLLSELLKTIPSYTASIKDERYNHEPGCQLGTLKNSLVWSMDLGLKTAWYPAENSLESYHIF